MRRLRWSCPVLYTFSIHLSRGKLRDRGRPVARACSYNHDDMAKEPEPLLEIEIDDEKRTKAVDMLYEAMIFWHDRGQKIIKAAVHKLKMENEGKEAAALLKLFKDADDRWIDIATRLAPYQSSKLSSTVIKKVEEKRFVIAIPAPIEDEKKWLETVQKEAAMLPKPNVIQNLFSDQTIDEIEFDDVNENEVH